MLSAQTTAALVAGARAPAGPVPQAAVRVLRAVLLAGARVEPGTELLVERGLASELVSAGKAQRIDAITAKPKPAAKTAAKE